MGSSASQLILFLECAHQQWLFSRAFFWSCRSWSLIVFFVPKDCILDCFVLKEKSTAVNNATLKIQKVDFPLQVDHLAVSSVFFCEISNGNLSLQ